LENLGDNVDINRAWESVRKNVKASTLERLSYYEFKQHKL